MSTPPPAAVLVVETDLHGCQALGPLLTDALAPCLDCLLERRRASGQPLGTVRLLQLDDTQLERMHESRMWGRRLRPDGGSERLLCSRPLDHVCPLDDQPHSALISALVPDDAVGPNLGLITSVQTSSWVPGHFTCMALGSAGVGSAGVPLRASGTATAADASQARRLAVYEALEHHAAGWWLPADLADEAPAHAVVYGARPWVQAYNLGSGGAVWVPATSVYMPFPDGRGGFTGHSDGLACGTSVHDALQRAVAELLERRAVDRLWSHLSPRVVAGVVDGSATGAELTAPLNAGIPATWRGVIARPMGQSVALCLWATDVGPPYGWVGFGCDTDDTLAQAKAQREAVHVLAHMRRLSANGDGAWGDVAGAVVGSLSPMDQRVVALAFQPGLAQRWEACLKAWAIQDKGKAEAAHQTVDADALAWRDITPPDVRRLGLCVVRAVWTDLRPG